MAIARLRQMVRTCAMFGGAVLLANCRDLQRTADTPGVDSLLVADSVALASADSAGRSGPFVERIVVFMEATPEQIERSRGDLSAEDFAVVADDLMFYRSAAYDYLRERNLPIKSLSGRRPLEFIVNGTMRRIDYADVPFLDVIVLYETGQEPRVIAPVDIGEVAEYFPHLRTRSTQ